MMGTKIDSGRIIFEKKTALLPLEKSVQDKAIAIFESLKKNLYNASFY